jgi:hypothetical protein
MWRLEDIMTGVHKAINIMSVQGKPLEFPDIQAHPEIIKWEQRNRCSMGNTNLTDLTADKNNTISPFNTTDYRQTGHYSSRRSSKQDSWKGTPCTPWNAKLTCSSKSHQRWNISLNNWSHDSAPLRLCIRVQVSSIFWKVIVAVILSKIVYMYMCPIQNSFWDRVISLYGTLYRLATCHVFTQVAKCIDVDGGIFKNVLYLVNCTNFLRWTVNTSIRNSA